jgi:hypothetical protein
MKYVPFARADIEEGRRVRELKGGRDRGLKKSHTVCDELPRDACQY